VKRKNKGVASWLAREEALLLAIISDVYQSAKIGCLRRPRYYVNSFTLGIFVYCLFRVYAKVQQL